MNAPTAQEALTGKLRQCPNCRSNDWATDGRVVTFLGLDASSRAVSVGGSVLPVIPVTCKVCGNVLLFNAMVLGLMR